MGTRTFIVKWTNFLTMLLAVAVIGFGVWMSTHHGSCKRSRTLLPVIILGALIFVVFHARTHTSPRPSPADIVYKRVTHGKHRESLSAGGAAAVMDS